MPRDYGKVSHRFWTGDTGKQIRVLGLETRVIATYLVTCGSSNMIGLYYLPLTLVSHETGIPFEGASKALRSLGEVGFAFYDEAEEMVFVPHMAREQIGETLKAGDKQRFGVIGLLKENQKSRFYNDFLAIYRAPFHLEELELSEAPSKVLQSPIEAPSKPESREQRAESREQEQRESLSPRDPSATATEYVAQADTVPFRWLDTFKSAHQRAHNGSFYGRGEQDAKACGKLLDLLTEMPVSERIDAWNRRDAIIAEFLTDGSPRLVNVGHSFAFFVEAFSALRIPRENRPKSCQQPDRADGRKDGPKPFRWPDLKVPQSRKVATP